MGPCVQPAPPTTGQLPGLQQYGGGPGEVVITGMEDLDGDRRRDVLVSGKGYTSATGNMATSVYLARGKCGKYLGSFWARGGSAVRAVLGRHNGLPVLQVGTRMTFKEQQTRYCFDGGIYIPMSGRVRHFYDHRRGRLRHLLNDSHWEPWRASADPSCRPLGHTSNTEKRRAGEHSRLGPTTKPGAGGAVKVAYPRVGSKPRRAILQSLRMVMQQELAQRVKFKIRPRNMKVAGQWALVHARPIRPNGAPVDYSITRYQQDIDDGTFDEGLHALLRLDRGIWAVVVHEIGCTDICWAGWGKKHGAPAALFKL